MMLYDDTSYLTNRTQVCVVDGHTSSDMETISGFPQESTLGPFMFLLYINDLSECLQNITSGMYADDTQIYASSASFPELVLKFTQDLKNLVKWLNFSK